MDDLALAIRRNRTVNGLRRDHSCKPAYDKRSKLIAALWEAPIPSGKWRYYDGLLYFMGLLHASGYFKIYNLY
jgi:hypothetical protein